MNKCSLLIFPYGLDHLSTEQTLDVMLSIVTLHIDGAITIRHHIEPLVGLSDDRDDWSFLNYVLQGHIMDYRERKLYR